MGGSAAHNRNLEDSGLLCWLYKVEHYTEAESYLAHLIDLMFVFSDHRNSEVFTIHHFTFRHEVN